MKKILLAITSIALLLLPSATPVYAQQGGGGGGSGTCGGTQTHLVTCDGQAGTAAIGDLIKIAIGVMTLLIGVVAPGGLAYAGILYASARDDREKVGQAKAVIRNVVLGLVLYAFTIAIINWLIPGGVIG